MIHIPFSLSPKTSFHLYQISTILSSSSFDPVHPPFTACTPTPTTLFDFRVFFSFLHKFPCAPLLLPFVMCYRSILAVDTDTIRSFSYLQRSTTWRIYVPFIDWTVWRPVCCCSVVAQRRPDKWNTRFVIDKCKRSTCVVLKVNFPSKLYIYITYMLYTIERDILPFYILLHPGCRFDLSIYLNLVFFWAHWALTNFPMIEIVHNSKSCGTRSVNFFFSHCTGSKFLFLCWAIFYCVVWGPNVRVYLQHSGGTFAKRITCLVLFSNFSKCFASPRCYISIYIIFCHSLVCIKRRTAKDCTCII